MEPGPVDSGVLALSDTGHIAVVPLLALNKTSASHEVWETYWRLNKLGIIRGFMQYTGNWKVKLKLIRTYQNGLR